MNWQPVSTRGPRVRSSAATRASGRPTASTTVANASSHGTAAANAAAGATNSAAAPTRPPSALAVVVAVADAGPTGPNSRR